MCGLSMSTQTASGQSLPTNVLLGKKYLRLNQQYTVNLACHPVRVAVYSQQSNALDNDRHYMTYRRQFKACYNILYNENTRYLNKVKAIVRH